MKHLSTKKEKEYLKNFKNSNIDLSKFHHKEHIQLTYTLLCEKNIQESYLYIKTGILNILKSVGTDTTKYHETMTYAWIELVKYFMDKTIKCISFEEFIQKNTHLLNIDILYKYYSKELLNSKKARQEVLKPDIKNIL